MVTYLVENNVNKLLKKIAKQIGLHTSSVVLNVACEFDRVPHSIANIVESEGVYCVEINRDLVNADKNIKFCNVDRNRFPFPDETFDCVLSIFGVEHFKTDRVFRETRRTLKRGATFIFVIPNVLYPPFFLNRILGERFARFYYRRIARLPYQPHKAYYRFNRLGAIRRVARRTGFSNADFIFFGPAGILSYFNRFPLLQKATLLIERLLTNRFFFRFKPYIIAILKK